MCRVCARALASMIGKNKLRFSQIVVVWHLGGNIRRCEIEQVIRKSFQEPLNAPFLNGLFSSGFSRGKTAPYDEIVETPH